MSLTLTETEDRIVVLSELVTRMGAIKNRQYDASWKKRGGVSAFMMLARKWDRIEAAGNRLGFDIFKILRERIGKDDAADDIMDLINYLFLPLVEKSEVYEAVCERLRRFIAENDPSLRG